MRRSSGPDRSAARLRARFAAAAKPPRPRRRRSGLPFGLLAFAAFVGAAIGLVVTGDRAPPAALAGPAGPARVIDGDTLEIGGERIRLWGVDAPERDQVCQDAAGAAYSCGRLATSALSNLVAGRALTCQARDVDRYGRTVAQCSAGDDDLGGRMVREGHALDYTRYSKGAYLADELRARRTGAGVWQGAFSRPEDWRRNGG